MLVKGLRSLKDYVGQSIRIHCKLGGVFYFKVTEAGDSYLCGYDDEGLNLRVGAEDIDFIVG